MSNTKTAEDMNLIELHAAVVDRWKAEPELASYVYAPWNSLYWEDNVPFLSFTFLKWALTAPVADVVAYHTPGSGWKPS